MSGNSIVNKVWHAVMMLNPDAEFTCKTTNPNTVDNIIDEIVWIKNSVSKEDIKAKIPDAEAKIAQDAQDKIDNQNSGRTKLKNLGLTDAEINELTGT